jgi:hypothetical protein
MGVNELLNLITQLQVSHQVAEIVESQKLSTVIKYEKFKKAHLPIKRNKLKL